MVNASETVQTLRRYGISLLQDAGIESPAVDAGLLLIQVLGIDKIQLLTSNAPVEECSVKKFYKLLRRRAEGEPLQYILGRCEFMSLEFEVSRDTLIPRPDTEILVEQVLKREKMQAKRSLSVLDIGTGSGCIAISLAHYLPQAQVVAMDISDSALRIAERNAQRLNVVSRVQFQEWDILQGFPPGCGRFDYIVSNPPYISPAEIEKLQREVREFEPRRALDGGTDGLAFYRAITKSAAEFLKPGGVLVLEVGIGQAQAVAAMIDASECFAAAEIVRDLARIDRVVSAARLS